MSSEVPGETGTQRPADIKAVPVRHPGRWAAIVVIGVLVAMLVHTLVFARVDRGNGKETLFGWGTVGTYLFDHQILKGVLLTVELTVLAMLIGIVGGVLLAVMRLSSNPILSTASWVYLWFFRGTPLLVQVAFWYGGISYLYPKLRVGIPFGPSFLTLNANTLVTAFVAALVAFGFNEAAYMAEIVRAGILSVDEGQLEAASSLGMTRARTMRRIVLPQAMRVLIPPTGNELISMLKNTSLAYFAAVSELFYTQQLISAANYKIVPLLIVASLWYLVLTSLLMVGQYYIERYYARGSVRQLPPTPWQRLRTIVTTRQAPPPATVALDATAIGYRH